eukprot:3528974-Amphidinium_carterae.1
MMILYVSVSVWCAVTVESPRCSFTTRSADQYSQRFSMRLISHTALRSSRMITLSSSVLFSQTLDWLSFTAGYIAK